MLENSYETVIRRRRISTDVGYAWGVIETSI